MGVCTKTGFAKDALEGSVRAIGGEFYPAIRDSDDGVGGEVGVPWVFVTLQYPHLAGLGVGGEMMF